MGARSTVVSRAKQIYLSLKMSIYQQHSFVKSCSQLSVGSALEDRERAPLLGESERQKKMTPLPKGQMFMIGLVTFIGMLIFKFLYFRNDPIWSFVSICIFHGTRF